MKKITVLTSCLISSAMLMCNSGITAAASEAAADDTTYIEYTYEEYVELFEAGDWDTIDEYLEARYGSDEDDTDNTYTFDDIYNMTDDEFISYYYNND